jgi:hypothetical protein
MDDFFKNSDANSRMQLIMEEIAKISESIELSDIMMPSNSSIQKSNLEISKKDFFYEMALDTLQFTEIKLRFFENEITEIYKLIDEKERKTILHLNDILITTLCKVLGFELGRISYYTSNKSQIDKDQTIEIQSSINKTLALLKRLNYLEKTHESKAIITVLESQLIMLNKKLNRTPLLNKITNIFK